MRVILAPESLSRLFSLLSTSYELSELAEILACSPRTLRDWRAGRHSIPLRVFNQLCELSNLHESEFEYETIDEKTMKSNAGKIGGRQYWAKYGILGSIDDKMKGGQVSFELRKTKPSIYTRKAISLPGEDTDLAEFVGICMGDGGVSKYQLVISLNSVDDAAYVEFVAELGEKLFSIRPRLTYRKSAKCVNIVFSSANLVEFLHRKGLPYGDKLRGGLDVPDWIRNEDDLLVPCIRGLFDTDGSIFLEKHNTKNGTYAYPRMMFVSGSQTLLDSVHETLCHFGIHAKIRQSRSVSIERFTDIEKYFRIIGSSNPKHVERFITYGGVG